MRDLEGVGYNVLGVTIDGPDPLGRIHLDMRSGLSVLYGVNGAGKSRFLEAFAATMEGYGVGDGRGVVHVRVQDPSLAPKDGFLGALLGGLRVGAFVQESAGAVRAEVRALMDPASSFTEVVESHLSRGDWGWEFTELVIYEAARSGYFSLEAIGRNQPEWRIWVSDCIRPESPLEQAYLSVAPVVGQFTALMLNIESVDTDVGVEAIMAFSREIISSSPWHLRHPALLDMTEGSPFDRPTWVPVEIADVGRLTTAPVDIIRVDDDAPDLDGRTARELASGNGSLFEDIAAVSLNEEVAALVVRLEVSATRSLQDLVGAGQDLHFELRSPEEWFIGQPPAWVCKDEYDSTVPIDRLSTSRRRWATAAIRLALVGDGDPAADVPSIVVSDEPEAGVHRTGEAQVVNGLVGLTAGVRRAGVVATHSPAFLREPAARLLHVRRTLSGETMVAPLDGLPADEDLGLTSADLLAVRRVFVIVEGEHEKIVLQSLFRRELQRAFAELLVLRGAKQVITAAHAEWLLRASDAPLLIVLDRLGAHSGVQAAWDEARPHVAAGRIDEAIGAVQAIKNVRLDEAGFLARLGEEAIRTGTFKRLHVHGMSLDDILLYLPDGDRLFREKKDGRLRNTDVQIAAGSLDTIHPDLTDLMADIDRIAGLFGRPVS